MKGEKRLGSTSKSPEKSSFFDYDDSTFLHCCQLVETHRAGVQIMQVSLRYIPRESAAQKRANSFTYLESEKRSPAVMKGFTLRSSLIEHQIWQSVEYVLLVSACDNMNWS